MNTVFSYIVPRLSTQIENVATEALAYILRNDHARSGLMKLLGGIAPGLPPNLKFHTQHTEGEARPDMGGFDDNGTRRVFIENKFWAELTPNQPVEYLRKLAGHPNNPALLLMVVPEARTETVWRVCNHLLGAANASTSPRDSSAGVHRAETIDLGPEFAVKPILAITSWSNLLSAIEDELTDEPRSRNDLSQLRALCDAAVAEYVPFSTTELTNQRTPALLLQLSEVVRKAVEEEGEREGFLSTKTGNPGGRYALTQSWKRLGRYMRFPNGGNAVGVTIAIDFGLWRERWPTPLWLIFSKLEGRSVDVRRLLEPWAQQNGIAAFSAEDNDDFAVGIDVTAGEEKEHVIRSIVDQLRAVAEQLRQLPAKTGGTP